MMSRSSRPTTPSWKIIEDEIRVFCCMTAVNWLQINQFYDCTTEKSARFHIFTEKPNGSQISEIFRKSDARGGTCPPCPPTHDASELEGFCTTNLDGILHTEVCQGNNIHYNLLLYSCCKIFIANWISTKIFKLLSISISSTGIA